MLGCNSNTGEISPKLLLEQYRKERNELDAKIRELERINTADSENSSSTPVTIITTTKENFEHEILVKATVDSRSSVAVSSRTSGQITSLYVTNGQTVTKGQLLAELDSDIIQRGIDEVTTQLEFAVTMFEKQERIYQQKAGSEVQYLQAKNNKESLERRLASLKEQLETTKIKAPTSGYIDGLRPKAGEVVMAGVPIMTIVNTSDLRVVADLSESHIATVQSGDAVRITFPETQTVVQNKIGVVSPTVNPINRTFRIEIPLRSVHPLPRPNTTCDLVIVDQVIPQSIVLPLEAIVKENGMTFVFVVEGKNVKKVPVEMGLVNGSRAVITSGLVEGKQVVVRGATQIADGQEVRVVS